MSDSHSARAHADLAPSAAHRWIVCPGSIGRSRGIPNKSSSFAAEGSAAHELASKCLDERKDAADFIGWLIDTQPADGKTPFCPPEKLLEEENGETTFEVNEDMADAVQVYLDHVRGLCAGEHVLTVEERLDMTDLHPSIFGTGDATVYLDAESWLHVVDYKHGKGVAVTAKDNPQLLLYGAGAARRHHNRAIKGVTLHIVQPRAPHPEGSVRSHDVDLLELLEFEDDVKVAAYATEAPDAPLSAGEHCRFCPASGVCEEHRRHTLAIADIEFTEEGIGALPAPDEMTPEYRARVLVAASAIHNWAKAVQQYEHDEAIAGNPPEGFKLVAKRATRKWKEGALGALTIDFGMAEDDLFDRKMRTPAKLESAFPGKNKAERQAAMAELVLKVSSGTNLVPVSDPRPAAKVGADDEFDAA